MCENQVFRILIKQTLSSSSLLSSLGSISHHCHVFIMLITCFKTSCLQVHQCVSHNETVYSEHVFTAMSLASDWLQQLLHATVISGVSCISNNDWLLHRRMEGILCRHCSSFTHTTMFSFIIWVQNRFTVTMSIVHCFTLHLLVMCVSNIKAWLQHNSWLALTTFY